MTTTSTASELAALLVDHELAGGGIAALPQVYEKCFVELAPVLGARGVRGIFVRAVELVRTKHTVLQSLAPSEDDRSAASPLAACLASVTPEEARGVAVALYTAFFNLIVRFVGQGLTFRLLSAAWRQLDLKETR